jgi:hypothetical protein
MTVRKEMLIMPEDELLNDDNIALTDEEEEEWWKETIEDGFPEQPEE